MIKMKVSPEEATKILGGVRHARFQSAIESRWIINDDGQPTVQSVYWLYCWAKTGMGSRDAAADAQSAFNRLFDKSYDWFDRRVDHSEAQRLRYTRGPLRWKE